MTKVSVRLCAVEFLNTLPIVYGLEHNRIAHDFELDYANPAVCAQRLRQRQADVALIPSIEYSQIRAERDLRMVPEIAITSHGTVQSVELFFNRGIGQVRRIAVDEKSRTSVALLRIVLREKYDIDADFVPMSPDLERMLQHADAALIIGDQALDLAGSMDNRLDLGEEWADLTDGLPFVYSFWAGVEGALSRRDVETLIQSRDMGTACLESIAQDYSASPRSNGRPAADVLQYLTNNIQYHLGKAELEGLKEYYTYCYYHGLIDEIPELQFYTSLESAIS